MIFGLDNEFCLLVQYLLYFCVLKPKHDNDAETVAYD